METKSLLKWQVKEVYQQGNKVIVEGEPFSAEYDSPSFIQTIAAAFSIPKEITLAIEYGEATPFMKYIDSDEHVIAKIAYVPSCIEEGFQLANELIELAMTDPLKRNKINKSNMRIPVVFSNDSIMAGNKIFRQVNKESATMTLIFNEVFNIDTEKYTFYMDTVGGRSFFLHIANKNHTEKISTLAYSPRTLDEAFATANALINEFNKKMNPQEKPIEFINLKKEVYIEEDGTLVIEDCTYKFDHKLPELMPIRPISHAFGLARGILKVIQKEMFYIKNGEIIQSMPYNPKDLKDAFTIADQLISKVNDSHKTEAREKIAEAKSEEAKQFLADMRIVKEIEDDKERSKASREYADKYSMKYAPFDEYGEMDTRFIQELEEPKNKAFLEVITEASNEHVSKLSTLEKLAAIFTTMGLNPRNTRHRECAMEMIKKMAKNGEFDDYKGGMK